MGFTEKITELRRARGLTQEALGDAVGVTAQAVSKWECGTAIPDITLLPKLCETLDTTADALLDIPAEIRNRHILLDFCVWAADNKPRRTKILLEAVGRLFANGLGNPGGNCLALGGTHVRLRMRDEVGGESAFLMDGRETQRRYLSAQPERLDDFLRIFRDGRALTILREISDDKPLTRDELAEKCSIPAEELRNVLLDLLDREILVVMRGPDGNRGYLRGSGYAAVLMVLAACDAAGCLDGPGINAAWGDPEEE